MDGSHSTPQSDRRLAIVVRGVVQGVGFRPFVYNTACSHGLSGWVMNQADAVRIEVQGAVEAVDTFLRCLRDNAPRQARIERLEIAQIASENAVGHVFEIRSSQGEATPRPTIPADLATCAECREEIRMTGERRFGYPFTNCTNCGPRWSIIEQLPYDRPRTSMAHFPMCPQCRAEYEDPADRRFHAQPIACPACGPGLQLVDGRGHELAAGGEALEGAVAALRSGQIVAMKGLGGFQLLVDATDGEAVARLRERKRRPHRPFAVMLPSIEDVRRRCEVSEAEEEAMASYQAPIVLVRRREDDIAEGVAPGNPYLGVMLPYTPLHHLLLAALARPIVCTSGNLSEEPMATATEDAVQRLGPIADVLLTHNRPIVRPVDDSIVRVGPEGAQVLRRARGFAPLPIELGIAGPTVLAVGGHLKNTVALALKAAREAGGSSTAGGQRQCKTSVVISPHIGDLESVLSIEVHRNAVRDLVSFFRVSPEAVACDLHPDYASTRYAEALAAQWNVPLVRVQHHHAHVGACMAEHHLTGPVLGLSWDGTGYGSDGTVWGGEALVCEGAEYVRVSHLRRFSLPGGDQAVREPRRSALGLLFEISGEDAGEHASGWFKEAERRTLLAVLSRRLHSPRTSSMGRLFDAVAALCGLPTVISFEGQAAMALEYAADAQEQGAYPLPLSDDTPAVADWEPLVRSVMADRARGVPVGRISSRFHHALAELAVATAKRFGCAQVALTGGCFHNAFLTGCVRRRLLEAGFQVYLPRQVPPGDGGIALGQVFVAAHHVLGSSREDGSVLAERKAGASPTGSAVHLERFSDKGF